VAFWHSGVLPSWPAEIVLCLKIVGLPQPLILFLALMFPWWPACLLRLRVVCLPRLFGWLPRHVGICIGFVVNHLLISRQDRRLRAIRQAALI